MKHLPGTRGTLWQRRQSDQGSLLAGIVITGGRGIAAITSRLPFTSPRSRRQKPEAQPANGENPLNGLRAGEKTSDSSGGQVSLGRFWAL